VRVVRTIGFSSEEFDPLCGCRESGKSGMRGSYAAPSCFQPLLTADSKVARLDLTKSMSRKRHGGPPPAL